MVVCVRTGMARSLERLWDDGRQEESSKDLKKNLTHSCHFLGGKVEIVLTQPEKLTTQEISETFFLFAATGLEVRFSTSELKLQSPGILRFWKSGSYYWARKHRMRQVVSMVARDTAFPLTPHIEYSRMWGCCYFNITTRFCCGAACCILVTDSNINLFYLISWYIIEE